MDKLKCLNSIEELKQNDILNVDTTMMLKTTNKEMKTLLFNLSKVMNPSGEGDFRTLNENQLTEIDVFEGITVYLRAYIADRNAPATITVQYMSPGKDLTVFASRQCKEPSEENNQGKYHCVRYE